MEDKPRKTIDGSFTKDLPVGYCRYIKHRGCLTLKQLKRQKCNAKHCPLLTKYPHEYWTRREEIKKLKREKKLS